MKFLSSVGKAAAQTAPDQQHLPVGVAQRSSGLAGWMTGRPYTPYGSRNVEKLVGDSFERTTWVYRSVTARANNYAALPSLVRRGSRDKGTEIANHPLLPLLNEDASDWERAEIFKWRLSATVDLSPKGAFVEVIRNYGGDPIYVGLIHPDHINPIPSETPGRILDGWMVTVGGTVVTLPPEQVVWVKRPHPLSMWRSFTAVEAAGLAVDTDWYAHLYNRSFLANDGRPGGVVMVSGLISTQDGEELKQRFNGGAPTAGQWHILEGAEGDSGIDVVDLAATPREAAYHESIASTKDETFTAFGTPESIAGNASGRTFNNVDAEQEIFWLYEEMPHCHLINGALGQITGKGEFVTNDFDAVPALQRARQERRQEMREELNDGAITVDEYRTATEVGRDAFDVPESRVPYMPLGRTALFTDPEAEPKTPPTPPAAVPAPADGTAPAPNGNGNGGGPVRRTDLAPARA